MSYPDPYQPQQQPPPGPYPPAPPPPSGPYGYGHAPNGGYPPAQSYGAAPQLPYYPPPAVTPPTSKQSDGDSRGWQLLDGLLNLFTGSTSYGFGKTARDRAKVTLLLGVITIAVITILVVVLP